MVFPINSMIIDNNRFQKIDKKIFTTKANYNVTKQKKASNICTTAI